MHPEDRQGVQDCLHAVTSGEIDEFARDVRIIKPDGSTIWIHAVARATRDASGKLIRLDGIDQDITQRKQIEQELRHAQKMEAVARLAGGIAHDFNNLLTVIKGYCELLLSGSHQRDVPAISLRDSLHEIRDASDRAARLTGQLLVFSRRAVVQPRVIDVSEAVRAARPLMERLVDSQIRLQFNLSEQLPAVVADDAQLEQVVINLVINARDAMPQGGQLSVDTTERTFENEVELHGRLVRPGKYAVLSVSDTGRGIARRDQSRIFEPFFSTKGDCQAAGLGLSVVHGVVTEYGGYVVFESNPNGGTTFHALLPTLSAGCRTASSQSAHGAYQPRFGTSNL